MSEKELNIEQSWRKFENQQDEDIDYSDVPELNDHFWKNAKLVKAIEKKPFRNRKRVGNSPLDLP